jgi:VWFA-related protein
MKQEKAMKSAIVASMLLSVSLAAAQQPPITRTTTTGVLIDVSVVDRQGRPVLDLRPEEFELEEDGKRQQIGAVSLVHAGVSRGVSGAAESATPTPAARTGDRAPGGEPPAGAVTDETPSVTAILFDRLTNEMRPLAHRAARAHVASMSSPRDYAGVFLADQSLVTFASFTNDVKTLGAAVDRLGGTPATNVSPEAERAAYSRVQNLPIDPNQPVVPSAESGSGWINPIEREKALTSSDPARQAEIRMRQMELRMMESFRPMLEEFHGHASLAALRAVVGSMASLPGRKNILYFSEALPLTDVVKPKFEALIHEANRNNITFYTVDAAGLRVHSEEARVARNADLAGARGIGDVQRGEGAWTKDIERQSDLLSSRPAAVLGRLAKETGGFLIENTNDLASGFARMQQERTTYYLLAYQPTNMSPDGKFRKIKVKVKRSGVTVRSRPGYVAAQR